MGSSGMEMENGSIDETVGGLVWVRRRNGSWWPGQIICVDELPKSRLLGEKTGTPVKLLGRDDASFDWYNFNKSRRVKTFRCGEFDDCIEKAKASISTNKKSVKYARREDAIICALEIENCYEMRDENDSAEKLDGNISTNSLVTDGSRNNEDDQSAPLKKRKVARTLSHLSSSSAETNVMSPAEPSSTKGKRPKTPNDSEDDGIVGIKRMRGIKDLVFDISTKIKDEVDGESDHVNIDNTKKGNYVVSENPANSDTSNSSLAKKKRSGVAYENGHEFKRRKDRRRTLTRVLEESVMVSVPVICNELSGTVGSQLMVVSEREAAVEPVNSDSITADNANNCLDGAEGQSKNVALSTRLNVPCNPSCGDRKHKKINGAGCLLPNGGALGELYDVHLSMDDDDDAGFTHIIPMVSSGEVKTDCTNLPLPSKQINDVPVTNRDVPKSVSTGLAAVREGIGNDLLHSSSAWQSKGKRNSRRTPNHKKQVLNNIEGVLNDGSSCQGSVLKQQLGGSSECLDLINGSKQDECTLEPKEGSLNLNSHRERIDGVEDETKGSTRSLPYRHSRLVVPSKYEDADFPTRNARLEHGAEQCLHDIHIEVKPVNRAHHVPIVSFMSKFNGKAIVGHPLTVEIMENGYSDKLCKHLTYNAKHRSAEGSRLMKQSKSNRGSNKSLLRNTSKESKKTKRLSALSGFQKSTENAQNPGVEKPMSPAIACIPLNVVFSRLNEAVNGSKQHHYRTLSK